MENINIYILDKVAWEVGPKKKRLHEKNFFLPRRMREEFAGRVSDIQCWSKPNVWSLGFSVWTTCLHRVDSVIREKLYLSLNLYWLVYNL